MIRSMESMEATCAASTERSGSDTVIKKPTKKAMRSILKSLRPAVMCAPTYSPIGAMAVSAPNVKRPMPKTSMAAPSKKQSSASLDTGVKVKHIKKTMIVTGNTAATDSLTFA